MIAGKDEVRRGFPSAIPQENILKIAEKLIEKYNISNDELITLSNTFEESNFLIPISIFRSGLSPLEAISKYLHEEVELNCAKIARTLRRSPSSIWNSYKDGRSKLPAKLEKTNSEYAIPIEVFASERLSVLEALVFHLKSRFNLKLSKIAEMTGKNDRTIWTVYDRARKKLK